VSATGTTPTPAPAREQALPTPVTRCLDCGAPLAGKFCGECGQRARLRSILLPTLAHDVIHDLGHVDSRVWRTGKPSGVVTGKDGEALSQAMDELSCEMTSQAASAPAADPDSSVILDADCGQFKWSAAGRTWLEPGVYRVCEKLKTVSKREFGRALFMGMRQVYRPSRLLTAFKYVVVLITYGISLLLTFVGTIFYTALTV